jgi:2-hydroxychromene-2-carboxylate isomerase
LLPDFLVHEEGVKKMAGSGPLVVDFYFGIGSRYSYLASTQLAAFETETGARFNWIVVDSAKLFEARGQNPFAVPNGVGQYDWAYRRQDAEAWAEFYGVPFLEPHGRLKLDSHLFSLACTAARRMGAAEIYAQALFRAVFVEDLPAVDRDVCIARAGTIGLDTRAFAELLDSSETREEQEKTLREAVRRGVFGVPTFGLGSRLIWGNDRLVLLRHEILKKTG